MANPTQLTNLQELRLVRAELLAKKQLTLAESLLLTMGQSGDETIDAQLVVALAQVLATNYLAEATKG